MTFGVQYHELARDDLYQIWSWYEDRQPGLGDRFASAVDEALDRLAEWPNSGSQVHRDDDGVNERIVGVAGFAHVVGYRVMGDTVVVIAIYHERRRPEFGSDRPL